jgi:hypothetical protein
MMKNGDKPAHPFNAIQHGYQPSFGLTKREYFAGLAMQGMVTASHYSMSIGHLPQLDVCVKHAVEMADALLAELEKTAQP